MQELEINIMNWKVLVFLIFALIIPISQAYSLSDVSVIPSGSLAPGTSVTASFEIDILPVILSTFPEGNTLQFTTDLDNANWTWWLMLDGIGCPHPTVRGRVLQMTSWDLMYRRNIGSESVRILLEGNAPQVTATQNKYIFDIMELDPGYNIIPDSETKRISLVVNPSDIVNGVASLTTDLQSLRAEITNKTALGIDTSKAEEKYRQIEQEIKSAQAFPPNGYTNAMIHLTDAQALILSGKKDLDEAWALKTVNDAQNPIYATDKIIEYLQANESTKDNPRLKKLITEKESAAQLIAVARGEVLNGNYEQARSTARRAQEAGNQTYYDAIYLKNIVDESSFILFALSWVGTIVFVVVGMILVIRYRKKQKEKKEEPK